MIAQKDCVIRICNLEDIHICGVFYYGRDINRVIEILKTSPTDIFTGKFEMIKNSMIELINCAFDMTNSNIITKRRCIFCGHYYLMKQFMRNPY